MMVREKFRSNITVDFEFFWVYRILLKYLQHEPTSLFCPNEEKQYFLLLIPIQHKCFLIPIQQNCFAN